MAARIWLLAAALLLPGCSARAADLVTPAPQAEIASMTVEEQALVDRLKKQATTKSLTVIRLDLGLDPRVLPDRHVVAVDGDFRETIRVVPRTTPLRPRVAGLHARLHLL